VTIVCYSVPTEGTSPAWARAFARGCGGVVSTSNALSEGDVALFGSPARWQVLLDARRQGRTWFYGDHAYFGRRQYFRVTRNAFQHDGHGQADPARFDGFGVPVKPWRGTGRCILLCPNSPRFFQQFGMTADRWIADTVEKVQRHTDRPIVVRWKDSSRDFAQDLEGAWAVVVFVSVCGVHASLAGVPCFATADCASRSFGSGDLALIEAPVRPDNRFEMACVLAANQWTLGEMASGQAWKELKSETVAQLAFPR
jgi:hypothetical protein